MNKQELKQLIKEFKNNLYNNTSLIVYKDKEDGKIKIEIINNSYKFMYDILAIIFYNDVFNCCEFIYYGKYPESFLVKYQKDMYKSLVNYL